MSMKFRVTLLSGTNINGITNGSQPNEILCTYVFGSSEYKGFVECHIINPRGGRKILHINGSLIISITHEATTGETEEANAGGN